MSFRTTLVRCAKEAQHRSPAIKFPDRKHANHDSSHSIKPHPCAPQSVIDDFPRFKSSQSSSLSSSQAAQNSSSYGGPVDPSSQGKDSPQTASSSGGGSGGSGQSVIEEWEMPEYLKRTKYAPTESEIEAIQSGGATEATAVTRETKLTWYTEQI
ncbi:hypothetical protein JCM16303_002293 [Sporobolomyces ruberrimus]